MLLEQHSGEQRTLFQQHFLVKYVHRKPIGFILLRLICAKKVLVFNSDLGYKGLNIIFKNNWENSQENMALKGL